MATKINDADPCCRRQDSTQVVTATENGESLLLRLEDPTVVHDHQQVQAIFLTGKILHRTQDPQKDRCCEGDGLRCTTPTLQQ